MRDVAGGLHVIRSVIGVYEGSAIWMWEPEGRWVMTFDPPLNLPPQSTVRVVFDPPPVPTEVGCAVTIQHVQVPVMDLRPWWRRLVAPRDPGEVAQLLAPVRDGRR